ncbi:MAG: hemolysin family protein [bacterium]|nr:hemolysin family protein [bacterium]
MIELAVAVGFAVGISALCSLFEAVLYSVPVGHLENMAESGSASGRILRDMRGNIDRPIAAILSLNTIANTAGAAIAGAAAANVFGHDKLVWFSAFFTLAILVFSEVIPKTIGVIHARGMASVIARPLQGLVWAFRPLTWFTGKLTNVMARGNAESDVSIQEITVLARLGLKAGTIGPEEAAVIENILSLEARTVRDIMTPRTVMSSLSVSMTIGALKGSEELATAFNHSRVPVYDRDADDVVGVVLRRDILTAMAEDQWDRLLEEFMRPVDFVTETLSVNRLLRRLLETRQHLVLVINEYGGLAGLVTLEDVLEEILGTEIVGEFDPAIDMRELARLRRRESLERRRRRAR